MKKYKTKLIFPLLILILPLIMLIGFSTWIVVTDVYIVPTNDPNHHLLTYFNENDNVTTYNGSNQQPAIKEEYKDYASSINSSVKFYYKAANTFGTFTEGTPVDAGDYIVKIVPISMSSGETDDPFTSDSGNNISDVNKDSGPIYVNFKINKATPTITITGDSLGTINEGDNVSNLSTLAETKYIDYVLTDSYSYVTANPSTLSGDNTGSANKTHSVTIKWNPTTETEKLNYNSTTITTNLIVKSVAYCGTNYYGKIENAVSNNQSGTIYVIPGTNPTIKTNLTIPSTCILNIPYEGELLGQQTTEYVTSSGGSNSSNAYLDSSLLTNTVSIANGYTLTNNGTINIGGIRSGGSGGHRSGYTTGKYAKITLLGTAGLTSNGNITCFGFIDSSASGLFTLNNNSTLTAPLVVWEHRGGSIFAGMAGGYSALIGGAFTGEVNATLQAAPFNRFEFPNVVSRMKVNYGASYVGHASLYANSEQNTSSIVFIGSQEGALFQMTSANGYVDYKYTAGTRPLMDLDFYGNGKMNSFKISLKVDAKIREVTVNLSTKDILLPISYLFDISLNKLSSQSNATFTTAQGLKIMPGSKFAINQGVTFDSSNIYIMDKFTSWKDVGTKHVPEYSSNEVPGLLIVNGILNVPTIAGAVYSNKMDSTLNVSTGSSLIVKEINGGDVEGSTYDDYSDTLKFYTYNGSISSSIVSGQSKGKYYSFDTNTSSISTTDTGWYSSNCVKQLTYDFKGGSGTNTFTSKQILIFNDAYTVTESDLQTLSKNYHNFTGWVTSAGKAVTIGTVLSSTELSLIADYNPIDYNIIYIHINDGKTLTGVTNSSPSTFNYETNSTISSPSLTGYTFAGWYLDSEYTPAKQISNFIGIDLVNYLVDTNSDSVDDSIYVYSKWTQKYIVNYNFGNNPMGYNGGESGVAAFSTVTTIVGEEDDVAEYVFEYDLATEYKDYNTNTEKQYYFGGWYLNADFTGTAYDINTDITSSMFTDKVLTFYAKWITKNKVIVRDIHRTSSSVLSTGTESWYHDEQEFTIPTTYTNREDNYYFDGWSYTVGSVTTNIDDISIPIKITSDTYINTNYLKIVSVTAKASGNIIKYVTLKVKVTGYYKGTNDTSFSYLAEEQKVSVTNSSSSFKCVEGSTLICTGSQVGGTGNISISGTYTNISGSDGQENRTLVIKTSDIIITCS